MSKETQFFLKNKAIHWIMELVFLPQIEDFAVGSITGKSVSVGICAGILCA